MTDFGRIQVTSIEPASIVFSKQPSNSGTSYLQKELKEIDRDKASGVTIELTEGNLQKLTGFVEGPKDTSYEGGYFVVDIILGTSAS